MTQKQLTQEDVYRLVGEVNEACLELGIDMQVKVRRTWLQRVRSWLWEW